jgi:hypothetical protein
MVNCKKKTIYESKKIIIIYRKMVLVGSATGAISQFIASPTDLVKVIMQSDGKRALDGQPRRFLFSFKNQ